MAFLTIAFFGVWLIWEGNWRGKGEDVGKVGTGIAGGGGASSVSYRHNFLVS